MYSSMIECAKNMHWEGFLAVLDDRMVWTTHRYALGDPTDGGKARVPTLKEKQADGSVCNAVMNADKARVLKKVFFLRPVEAEAVADEDEYAPPKFR